MLCDLQIFSGSIYYLKQPQAQSHFLFPAVFGINLIPFFEWKKVAVHSINYCETLLKGTYVFSGLPTVQVLNFRAVLTFRGMIRWRQNPARKKSLQSCAFRKHCAVMHVSAIVDVLPGYRGTFFWGGGGHVLSGHCSRQQISVKNEGYLFSEGYLFTGFYAISSSSISCRTIWGRGEEWRVQKVLEIGQSNVLHDCASLYIYQKNSTTQIHDIDKINSVFFLKRPTRHLLLVGLQVIHLDCDFLTLDCNDQALRWQLGFLRLRFLWSMTFRQLELLWDNSKNLLRQLELLWDYGLQSSPVSCKSPTALLFQCRYQAIVTEWLKLDFFILPWSPNDSHCGRLKLSSPLYQRDTTSI